MPMGSLGVTAGRDKAREYLQLPRGGGSAAARACSGALQMAHAHVQFVPDKYKEFLFLSKMSLPGASPGIREDL